MAAKYWFKWNEYKSTDYGVYIGEQPRIIRAAERVNFITVPGRSGSLTQLEGQDVYDDVIMPIECVMKDTSGLSDFSRRFRGAGELRLAARPGGYYKGRIVNQIEIEQVMRARENRNFTINFRLDPFFYAEDVEPVTFYNSGSAITNPGDISSKPIIRVTGTGDVTLIIGTHTVALLGMTGSEITLDAQIEEAYGAYESMNDRVSGEMPRIDPGLNGVSWVGSVSRVVIEPNWVYSVPV